MWLFTSGFFHLANIFEVDRSKHWRQTHRISEKSLCICRQKNATGCAATETEQGKNPSQPPPFSLIKPTPRNVLAQLVYIVGTGQKPWQIKSTGVCLALTQELKQIWEQSYPIESQTCWQLIQVHTHTRWQSSRTGDRSSLVPYFQVSTVFCTYPIFSICGMSFHC